jgi:hypothetical protein
MSNTTRKAASDSDLQILIPLVCIMSFLGFIGTSVMS